MNKKNINILYIFHHFPLDSYKVSIPYENSSNIDELKKKIQDNRGCRLILIGKVEDLQELTDENSLHYIIKIYTLGNGATLNINNIPVISVNTNEQDLVRDVMLSAIGYTQEKQMQQEEAGKRDVADERAKDVLRLLDELQALISNRQ